MFDLLKNTNPAAVCHHCTIDCTLHVILDFLLRKKQRSPRLFIDKQTLVLLDRFSTRGKLCLFPRLLNTFNLCELTVRWWLGVTPWGRLSGCACSTAN